MASNDSMMPIPSNKIIPLNKLSFRRTFLFHLKTNANPRLLFKLMQISKYFFPKEFPFMVVEDLRHEYDKWKCLLPDERQDGYQNLYLNTLKKPLWITNILAFRYGFKDIPYFLSKTAVCDVKKLNINFQRLKISEFKFLISSKTVENVTLFYTEVIYDDGSIVALEEILKLLPNLKEFSWTFIKTTSNCTSTVKLVEQLNPSILTRFELKRIAETFDFNLFAEFMDKTPSITFILRFTDDLSEEYVKILQAYVDKLIETGEYKNRKICIEFPQQNKAFYKILNHHFWDD